MKRGSSLVLILFLCFVFSTLPLVSATDDSWTTLQSMPTARSGHGIAVVDGKIYVMGGSFGKGPLGNNEVYTPITDTWVTKNPILTPRSSFGIAVVGDWIYVIGGGVTGWVNSSINEAYNCQTDTWETKTQMPTSRAFLVAHEVDGKIYVMAGCTFPHPSFPALCNTTEIYDPLTDSWTTGAPMPNYEGLGMPEDMASSVSENKIYIIYEETLYIYNVDTDSWSFGPDIPTRVRGKAACFTTGVFAPKRLHVTGLDLHYIYNPETDNWTTATPMSNSRYFTQIGVVDDILYAIGGGIGDPLGTPAVGYESTNTNEKYTPIGYIPEFPSWTILPLVLMISLTIVLFKKKIRRQFS